MNRAGGGAKQQANFEFPDESSSADESEHEQGKR